MTFEEWCKDTYIWPADELPRLEGKDLEAAWQAATLAERERAAKVAEDFEPNKNWRKHGTTEEQIAAAIRKGEVV